MNKRQKLVVLYESIMLILVIISVSTLFTPDKIELKRLNTFVWFVFLIDVGIKFIKALSKWKYVKSNPFDIVSIIPLEDIFLLARFARIIKLFRYKNLIKRYLDKINTRMHLIKFSRITVIITTLNIIIAIILTHMTSLSLINSIIWTQLNFFKFNYVSEHNQHSIMLTLSIILKIGGVLYMGIVINKLMHFAKQYFIKFKSKKDEHKT